MPVLGSGVAPGDLVLDLVLKECVGDGQLVEGAQLKEPLAVLVHLANAVVSEGRWPCVVVSAHLCVEVPKDVESFIAGHASDDPVKGIGVHESSLHVAPLGIRCCRTSCSDLA